VLVSQCRCIRTTRLLPLWLQSPRERMLQATRRKHPKDELHAQLPLQKPSQCQQVSAICETRHDTRAPLSVGLRSEASSLMRGPARAVGDVWSLGLRLRHKRRTSVRSNAPNVASRSLATTSFNYCGSRLLRLICHMKMPLFILLYTHQHLVIVSNKQSMFGL